eukprot:ANDGO_04159.mRNA.1 Vesicle transport v-SNARE 13
MAEIFENYEQEYIEISASIKRHTDSLQSASGENRRQMIATLDREIEEAEDILRQMSLEARVAVGPVREQLKQRLTNYQKDSTKAKADLKRAKLDVSSAAGGRDALLSGTADSNQAYRDRLVASTDRLSSQGSRIKDATRVAEETETVGVGIMSELSKQREQIQRAQGHLSETNTQISRSRRILGEMARRIVTNKILFGFIILILVAAIFLVIYFKLIKGN